MNVKKQKVSINYTCYEAGSDIVLLFQNRQYKSICIYIQYCRPFRFGLCHKANSHKIACTFCHPKFCHLVCIDFPLV